MKTDTLDHLPSSEEHISLKINGALTNGNSETTKRNPEKADLVPTSADVPVSQTSARCTSEEKCANGELKNGELNGHDDSFSNGSPAVAHLSDEELSDESMTLHVTDDEDEPVKENGKF